MKAITYFSVAAALIACSSTPEQQPVRPQAVRAVTVHQGPVVQGQRFLADVVPERIVRSIAQVPGTVSEFSVQEGIEVQEGRTLVRIAAPDIAARIARVRAERKRAQRERDFACSQLGTDRTLAQAGDVSATHLDRSEKGCASAELAVEAAQAAEREVSVAGTKALERAPFTGEVLVQLVDEGQTVMPGTPLLQFGSRNRLLRMRIPESDLDGVTIGTRVAFDEGSAKVTSVGAQAQGPGRLIEVLAQPVQPLAQRAGTTLSALMVYDERENATSVPESALGTDDTGRYVFVVEGEALRRLNVQLGPQQNGWVVIEPGLPEGSLVVTGGLSLVDVDRPVLAVSQ